tara:strand:+ start:410 stop:646 length:237 start_codon:yes stop_codon:yes gene_type:complete
MALRHAAVFLCLPEGLPAPVPPPPTMMKGCISALAFRHNGTIYESSGMLARGANACLRDHLAAGSTQQSAIAQRPLAH